MRLLLLGALLLGVVYAEDEVRCSDCHTTDPVFSHPVGILPSMKVPAALPLDEGRVTCNTCHVDAGAQAHLSKRAGAMLRVSEGLCLQCHGGARTLRSRMHGSSLSRAHLRWPDRETKPTDETTTCQACHDGTVGADAWQDARNPSSHRVGTELARTRGMRAPAMIPEAVRLFDGRVGCGSCHNPYAGDKGLLAMSNRGSRLCLSCHDK